MSDLEMFVLMLLHSRVPFDVECKDTETSVIRTVRTSVITDTFQDGVYQATFIDGAVGLQG